MEESRAALPTEVEEGVIPWESVVAMEKRIGGPVDSEQDILWVSPFDRFLNTKGAAHTLGFFYFFALFSTALIIATIAAVSRTGVPGLPSPPSLHATLAHPANRWLVTAVVQPALCGQMVLLALLCCTRVHGALCQFTLAIATFTAYAYTVLRTQPQEDIVWIAGYVVVLYALSWILMLRDLHVTTRPRGAVTVWACLHSVAYIYVFFLYAFNRDVAYTTTPGYLFLWLSFAQCLYVTPMYSKMYREMCITETA